MTMKAGAQPSSSKPSASAPRKSSPAQGTPPLSPPMDETQALSKYLHLKKIVTLEIWAIAGLGALVAALMPFARPIDLYFAMNPAKQVMQMVGLTMPNMTNHAILSWSVNSITEIMTMGFGDLDTKVPKERIRFTKEGWEAYTKAFIKGKIGEQFKNNQLVLTTVPSNTPVIIDQGVNQDQVYEWTVQMPVILTYATNNNVTSQKSGIVTLTIVRVDAEQSAAGIAIDKWAME